MKKRNFSKIVIKSLDNKNGSAFSEVYIDGHKIEGVRSYKLVQKVGDRAPRLILDLNALDLRVDGTILTYAKGMGAIRVEILRDDEPSEDGSKNH